MYLKKIYFYIASFTEKPWKANYQEVYSLFSIEWDKELNQWGKLSWCCCSVISEQPQPPLLK